MSQRLRPDAKLTSSADFERVYRRGRKWLDQDLILWCVRAPSGAQPPSPPRLGVSITRKLGIAVKRNRFKRLLKEAFRLNRHRLREGWDLMAYPRPGCRWRTLSDARESFLELCRKAGVLAS